MSLVINIECFGSDKRDIGTHWIRVWVDQHASQYVLVKRQITDALFSRDNFCFQKFLNKTPDGRFSESTFLQIIKMLVTIVVLFALCWLPLQTFLLLYYFVPGFDSYRTDEERQVYALSYFACHWLASANSMVNPFVYCFMSDNFRVSNLH